MPKIMFRPNPTPPPFVPPTPVPTDNLLQITPYPFEADEEFSFPYGFKHGKVIEITETEYERLKNM